MVLVGLVQNRAPIGRSARVLAQRLHLLVESVVLGLAHLAQRARVEVERLALLELARVALLAVHPRALALRQQTFEIRDVLVERFTGDLAGRAQAIALRI